MKIKGTEIKLKYTLRALFAFEQITQKTFKLESLIDQYIFYYCLVIAANPDINLSFDDFIDELDNNPNLIIEFNQFLSDEAKKQNTFANENFDDKKKF